MNQFTGIVYQSVLLSQKQPVRTVSMDESVQPNTSPAQWPGKKARPNTIVLIYHYLTGTTHLEIVTSYQNATDAMYVELLAMANLLSCHLLSFWRIEHMIQHSKTDT